MSRQTPQQIISTCREITSQFGRSVITEFLVEANEKILEFADKAHSNAQQIQLMGISNRMKEKAGECEELFINSLDNSFTLFARGQLVNHSSKAEDSSTEMSLVANDDLEEDLASSSLVRKAESHYQEDLFALNQRLALLNGGKKIDEGGNPIGPLRFTLALHDATMVLELESKLTVLFFKLFEKKVLPLLGDFYKEVNQCLIDANVLPNLNYSVSKKSESQSAHQAPPAPNEPPPPTPSEINPAITGQQQIPQQPMMPANWAQQIASQPPPAFIPRVNPQVAASVQVPDPKQFQSPEYQQQLYSGIQAMQGSIHRPMMVPGGQMASGNELINLLNNVQSMAATAAQQFDDPNQQLIPCASVQQTGAVTEQLQQSVGETGKNISDDDAGTIDLVGMIFEFMLSDEDLPDNVKAVLSYLHTPYLKIAFIDEALFAKPEHPARQLLNKLAEVGTKWVNADGTSQFKTFSKIKAIVRRILVDFDNTLEFLENLLAETNEFNDKVEGNVKMLEQRAAEKAKGEDKIRSVKALVNRTVKKKLSKEKLASPLIVLLLHPYSEYMTFTLLRNGEDSDEWDHCQLMIDDIIWSVKPKSDAEDKKRLVVMQEQLEEHLQYAFQTIGYDQAKSEKLLKAINELQVIALQNKTAQPAPEKIIKEIESTAVGEEEAKEEEMIEASKEELELMEKLKMVEFGTWIEFDDLQHKGKQQLKIAWFNSRTSHYMLVDKAGKQVATISGVEIARNMLDHNARIISGMAKPFFERALENIFTRLRVSAA